jgi:hypothetical protein
MLDEDRRNITALFASLTMLLETQEGFESTLAASRDWMAEVGFCGIQTIDLDAGHTAMIGSKRHRVQQIQPKLKPQPRGAKFPLIALARADKVDE